MWHLEGVSVENFAVYSFTDYVDDELYVRIRLFFTNICDVPYRVSHLNGAVSTQPHE
jgi:hypothetical protein